MIFGQIFVDVFCLIDNQHWKATVPSNIPYSYILKCFNSRMEKKTKAWIEAYRRVRTMVSIKVTWNAIK